MRSSGMPALLMTFACALGCATERPAGDAVDGSAAFPELTPHVAREIIESSPDFRLRESTVHALEWQMAFGEDENLWAIRKIRVPDGRMQIRVEVLDGARDWLDRAEYFSGGVVPMHLSRPITRRIVEVVAIRDAEFPQMKEVRFTWDYSETPEPLQRLKPELTAGPYEATARLQFQEDDWKMVGHLRESRIRL